MKKIILCITIALTFLNTSIYCQTVDLKWGDPMFQNKKTGNFKKILGENTKYVYYSIAGQYDENKVKIVVCDKETMKEIASRVVYDKKDKSFDFVKKAYWETVVYENKIYVVWGKPNDHGDKDFYVTTFDDKLNPLKELTKVYTGSTTGDPKDKKNYQFSINSNASSGDLLVIKWVAVKGEEEMIDYQYVDNNLSVIAAKQVKLPVIAQNSSGSEIEWELGADGNLHLKYSAKLSKEQSTELKKNEDREVSIYSIVNLKKGIIETFPFKFADKNIFDFSYTADKGAVKIVGLFCDLNKDRKGNSVHGLFYASIDPQTLKFTTDTKFTYFTNEQLGDFNTIERTQSADDGTVLFCSKTRNYTEVQSYTNSSGMTTTHTYQKCEKEGLTAIKVNANGEIIWTKKLERSVTYRGTDVHDIKVVVKDNKFVTFYGQKDSDGLPYVVFDNKTGEYEKKLFVNKDDSLHKYRKKIQSSYWLPVGDGYYFHTNIWLSQWVHSKVLNRIARVIIVK